MTAREVEPAITALANIPNSGMIVTGSSFAIAHRELVIKLANQHKLPTVYPAPVLCHRWRVDFLWGRCNRSTPTRGGVR
jgi:hypothetical protein